MWDMRHGGTGMSTNTFIYELYYVEMINRNIEGYLSCLSLQYDLVLSRCLSSLKFAKIFMYVNCLLSLTDDFADEEDWQDLFHYINRKDTTPFLGAGISKEHFGSGIELAEKIAKESYP